MSGPFPEVEALIPHRGLACWLDAVLEHGGDRTRCRARVVPAHPIAVDGRFPAVAAVEWIAQASAAHSALRGRAGGIAEAGVLAGISGFSADVEGFSPGERIEVAVTQVHGGDGPMAVFEGEVWCGTQSVARASLTVVRGGAAFGSPDEEAR